MTVRRTSAVHRPPGDDVLVSEGVLVELKCPHPKRVGKHTHSRLQGIRLEALRASRARKRLLLDARTLPLALHRFGACFPQGGENLHCFWALRVTSLGFRLAQKRVGDPVPDSSTATAIRCRSESSTCDSSDSQSSTALCSRTVDLSTKPNCARAIQAPKHSESWIQGCGI